MSWRRVDRWRRSCDASFRVIRNIGFLSFGSPEQVIDGWRHFGYVPRDGGTDAAGRMTASSAEVAKPDENDRGLANGCPSVLGPQKSPRHAHNVVSAAISTVCAEFADDKSIAGALEKGRPAARSRTMSSRLGRYLGSDLQE